MKQFKTILKFELDYYFTNKVFVGFTIALVLAVAVLLSFPRISALFQNDSVDSAESANPDSIVLLNSDEETYAFLSSYFPNIRFERTDAEEDEMKEKIKETESLYERGLLVTSPTSFTNIVKDITIYDSFEEQMKGAMRTKYQKDTLLSFGLSTSSADEVLHMEISADTIQTGKDQTQTFFFTYILIFGLYMAIILYGQLVATSVASEKSSRAMELLITSAKPTSLMFGKVIGSGLAGLLQMVAVLGSSFLFFHLNREYWEKNPIIQSIFNMPLYLLLFTLLFFLLGFFIYAFLYGAIGSLASKLEDINTSSLPLTFLFVAAFMVVITSMSSGNIDNPLMVACSYIPFTSPMAMFTRIAMGNVPTIGIVISIFILLLSTAAIGYLAAKIYRMGVLMYGNPPKLKTILKNLRTH